MNYENLIIFDLDGVLIDSKEIHYDALNYAIETVFGDKKYIISKEEHLSIYDGLPTKRKLELLTQKKGLPSNKHAEIESHKQSATYSKLRFYSNKNSTKVITDLKNRGYKIAVASNSIRETVKICLIALDIIDKVDYYISNEDVKKSKPNPEMYWDCMKALNSIPDKTWIVEDSHVGRQGAIDSGAHLIPVESPDDLSTDYIIGFIDDPGVKSKSIPWKDANMNVLVPMAGAGSRFSAAGYTFPKPLIEVNGKPMIQVVVNNLNIKAHYIYIVQKEHYEKYSLQYMLNLITPGCDIVQVDGVTEGAACTTLLAKNLIDNDKHLLIANSDQFMEWNSNETMYTLTSNRKVDGGILTFKSSHPKWSYAAIDGEGYVSEVAEKKPISDNATVGVYYWKKGSDYVKYAEDMIAKDIRTNNEFYVCPVFNQAIADGKKIITKQVKSMHGIGDPDSLRDFLQKGII